MALGCTGPLMMQNRGSVQAGVRYATKNPYSYVHSNVVGHVTLLEAIRVCRILPPSW